MPYVPRTTPAESEEEFFVEEILDSRGRGGSTEYLIKWEGYPEPTWVWYFHCNCPEKLAEFRRKKRIERRYQQARDQGRPMRRRRIPPVQVEAPSGSSGVEVIDLAPDVQEAVSEPVVVGLDVPWGPAAEGEACCIVCLENKITHLVDPCNHACLCSRCAVAVKTLRGCPKCRGKMTRIAPFYLG